VPRTRALAQPGQWLGPVTGRGWAGMGLAQPMWADRAQPKKNKKNKNKTNVYG